MKKKNIRPQQTAPVQRETTANSGSTQQGEGAKAAFSYTSFFSSDPFASDDAE